MKLSKPSNHSPIFQNTSLENLYDEYAPALLAYVLKINSDIHQAEMIVQNVFVQFNKKPQQLITSTLFVSLLNIARNEAIESLIHNSPLRVNSSGCGCVPMNSPHMQAHIQALPLIEKTILALSFYKGLDAKETADLLLLPLQLVQTKLNSAMQKLHENYVQERAGANDNKNFYLKCCG